MADTVVPPITAAPGTPTTPTSTTGVDKSTIAGNFQTFLTLLTTQLKNQNPLDPPELERSLQQAGLKTGDNGMQFSLRDQSFSGQNQNLADHPRSGAARLIIPDPEMTPVETVSSGYGRSLRLGTGIDIRV